jgi:Cupin
VSAVLPSHDRAATAVDRKATDRGAPPPVPLARLRLQGAIFLRGEYSEAWAYESLPQQDAAALLAPGAQRVVLFHVIGAGRAWIETDGGERHWADAGDVVVLPYGDAHRMGGTEPAPCVSVGTLIDPPPCRGCRSSGTVRAARGRS